MRTGDERTLRQVERRDSREHERLLVVHKQIKALETENTARIVPR